jgi:S1-C subfamily serine protease
MAFRWSSIIVAPISAAALGLGYGLGVSAPSQALGATAVAASAPRVHLASTSSSIVTTSNAQVTGPLTATTVSSVVSATEPAVVTIYTTVPGQIQNTPFGQQLTAPASGTGSGFIIASNGLILTNDHVVAGASTVEVRVNGYTQRFKAAVVGTDYSLDLALVKISPPRPLPTVTLAKGPNTAPIGAFSIAIGAPEGLYNTVTFGIISAKGRSFTIGGRHYTNLIQTDTPISPGNSGGPLLNLAGQVIGINTAVDAAGQNLGFSIPIQTAEQALSTMTNQHIVGQGWLGVVVAPVTPTLAQQDGLSVTSGALVIAVEPQSPASAAGIQPGDVIVGANGHTVANATTLTSIIEGAHPGQSMQFVIVRGSRHITVTAVLETRPSNAA